MQFQFVRRYIDDDGQTHSMANTLSRDFDTFLNAISHYTDLHEIRIDDGGIKDGEMERLAAVVERNPQLWKLDLLTNFITPDGVDALAEAAQKHGSLRQVNLSRNCLKGRAGGEAAGRLLAACPRIENFNISSNMLGDDGSMALADAVAAAPSLRQFFAANAENTEAGFAALVEAVAHHRGLCSANLMPRDKVMEDSPDVVHILKGLAAGDCPNLSVFTPHTEDSDRVCTRNKERTSAAAHLLEQDLATLTYSQHCAIAEHWPAINYNPQNIKPPLDTSKKSLDFMRQEFPCFLKELPGLPESGGIGALFMPDANGFAPLDNPRIWQHPQAVMAFVAANEQQLDAGFFARETPRGVSFLQSALGIAPVSMVLPMLNEAGVQLREDMLLDAARKPTPLFRQLLERQEAAQLFTEDNWKGGSPAAMRACAAHLPQELRENLPLHSLGAAMQQERCEAAALGR